MLDDRRRRRRRHRKSSVCALHRMCDSFLKHIICLFSGQVGRRQRRGSGAVHDAIRRCARHARRQSGRLRRRRSMGVIVIVVARATTTSFVVVVVNHDDESVDESTEHRRLHARNARLGSVHAFVPRPLLPERRRSYVQSRLLALVACAKIHFEMYA